MLTGGASAWCLPGLPAKRRHKNCGLARSSHESKAAVVQLSPDLVKGGGHSLRRGTVQAPEHTEGKCATIRSGASKGLLAEEGENSLSDSAQSHAATHPMGHASNRGQHSPTEGTAIHVVPVSAKRQRRGSSSHTHFGPKRDTTARGRTALLQKAQSISHLHQIIQTHLEHLDAVALAAASDRLVALLNVHVANGDFFHHSPPPQLDGHSSARAASAAAPVACLDGVDPATSDPSEEHKQSPSTITPSPMASSSVPKRPQDCETKQQQERRPSPGKQRAKLIRAFSTILGRADQLLRKDASQLQEQQGGKQTKQQQQQRQPLFPASCAVALLRGMARVSSVAVVEEAQQPQWHRVAVQLAGRVAWQHGLPTNSGSFPAEATLSVQHVVTCAWAATKLGVVPPKQPAQQHPTSSSNNAIQLWAFLLSELQRVSQHMNAMEVCNAAWSLTTSGQYQPAVMDLLVERAYGLLAQHFKLQKAHAAARQGSRQEAAGSHAAALQGRLSRKDCFSNQDVSNLVWVLGRTQHKAPHLLQLLEARAMQLIPTPLMLQGELRAKSLESLQQQQQQQRPQHCPPQESTLADGRLTFSTSNTHGGTTASPSVPASYPPPPHRQPSPALPSLHLAAQPNSAAPLLTKPSYTRPHPLTPSSEPPASTVSVSAVFPPFPTQHMPSGSPSPTHPASPATPPEPFSQAHTAAAASAPSPACADPPPRAPVSHETPLGLDHEPMSFAPLEPQHVANIAWGLGKADWPAPKLMCAIVTAIITDCIPLASFQSIHLAQLAWAIAKARDGGDTTARPPAPASPPSQHTTAAVPNGSIAASSSPQQNSQHGPNSSASSSSEEGNSAFADLRLLKQISKVLAGRMASMGAAEMCMVAWSLAVVRRPSHSLYHSIAARARALLHAGQLSLSNQATLLWAYARQGLYIEWLFDALCTAVLPSMRACSTGSLSMIMWALAATTGLGDGRGSALVQRHAALAKEASLVLHAELHSFSGNEVSNLAWALAEIGHYEPQLWDAMAQYLLQPPTQTSSGAFKNHRQRLQEGPSLQAHAAQQRSPTSLAGEASVEQGKGGEGNSPLRASGPVRHGEPLLARMQAFELSKLVWAYAKVGHVDEHLFGEVSELLCAAASHLPHRFSKAKRSAAAAAAAVQMRTHAHLGIPMPSSQQAAIPGGAVAHEGTSKRVKPHALHAGTVSRAMWAFAMLGLHDDPVLPALMPHVRAVLPFTEPRDVSAVLWALASSGLGSEDDDLVVACMTRANANLNAFTLHQLAELLWAAATLQSQPGRTHGLPALVTPILAHTKRTLQEHLSSAGRRGPSRTHMGGLRLEDVATIMWALITFRHYDPKLVKQVARAVTPLLQHCLSHHQQRHQPTMADTAEPQPRLPAHGSSPMPLPSSSAELMTPSTTTPSTTNSSSMPVPSSGTVEEFSSPSTTSTSTTNSSNSGLHQVRPAPPPFPVPSADPEHVVSLLHSFATCSSYQPSLYHAAGQLLADQLDVLGMEQLVQVAWVYAAMLPACLTTSRYLNGQGNREAGSGRRGEPSHSRSRGNLSAPAAADGDRSVSDRDSHEGISSSQRRPYSTSSSLRSLELLDAHLNLLHEAQVMLSAAVPANRRVRLPPQELLLLWQAHEVCAAAAPEVTQLRATLVVHHDCYEGKSEDGSNRQVGSTSALASELHPSQQGLEAATPFMMATGLYNQAVQVCSMVPRKRRSRQQAEMVAALESLGFASLPPRLPALPSASPAEEVALAMAGPDFIAGKQGNVKVAVMQVVPGEHTFLSFEQRLLAEHQVKVDLLQRHGWLVVQVPLAEWGQNSSQEQRVQDMDARLKWTLGNRNAVSPENCALLENPQF